MEQRDGGYDRFGHALGGGPPKRRLIELDPEPITHVWNIFRRRSGRTKAVTSAAAARSCQCRFKFPQMCRSKIPQLAGFGDQPAGW
jgi:hypothetical protein